MASILNDQERHEPLVRYPTVRNTNNSAPEIFRSSQASLYLNEGEDLENEELQQA
jgi:hypothetical protein